MFTLWVYIVVYLFVCVCVAKVLTCKTAVHYAVFSPIMLFFYALIFKTYPIMLLKLTAKIHPFETDPNMILKVTLYVQ